jgi:hypothetical protein
METEFPQDLRRKRMQENVHQSGVGADSMTQRQVNQNLRRQYGIREHYIKHAGRLWKRAIPRHSVQSQSRPRIGLETGNDLGSRTKILDNP